jgi:DNA-binding transcriptional regulator YiaG/uncharacterized phage-associated protein
MKTKQTSSTVLLKHEARIMEFRKEEFEIRFHYYKDTEAGIEYTTTELDELNYRQLTNKFRAKHNLPFPEEILGIRQKYDLSATKMSDILGFGVNTYRQYEAGEVPSQANGKLIKMAEDPSKFRDLVTLCDAIEDDFKEKLVAKLTNMIEKSEKRLTFFSANDPLAPHLSPSEYTGYKKPSRERFTQLIIRLAEDVKPFKTQLNKLLFYIDFAHYKRHGQSISGCVYAAISMGPVPDNFETTFETLAREGHFINEYIQFPDGNYGVQFIALKDKPFDPTQFNDEELVTIDKVISKLKKKKSSDLVSISHEEKAWIVNEKDKKKIAYDYAFDLKAI